MGVRRDPDASFADGLYQSGPHSPAVLLAGGPLLGHFSVASSDRSMGPINAPRCRSHSRLCDLLDSCQSPPEPGSDRYKSTDPGVLLLGADNIRPVLEDCQDPSPARSRAAMRYRSWFQMQPTRAGLCTSYLVPRTSVRWVGRASRCMDSVFGIRLQLHPDRCASPGQGYGSQHAPKIIGWVKHTDRGGGEATEYLHAIHDTSVDSERRGWIPPRPHHRYHLSAVIDSSTHPTPVRADRYVCIHPIDEEQC